MKWVNHVAIAGATTAVWRPELVPLAVLGSTAPDWMEWAYKWTTGRHIKHRGATHYVTSWLFGLGFGLWVWDWHFALSAFAAGGLSHVLCDACTASGVPLSGWSDRRFHLFGGRLKTGQMGEYWVAGAVVLACIGVAALTKSWGGGGFSPFFPDYADMYKKEIIDAAEWKANRFRWL
jgi:inner membrane protein